MINASKQAIWINYVFHEHKARFSLIKQKIISEFDIDMTFLFKKEPSL